MNYKTYAEAKIANPDCEIVTTGKDWSGDVVMVGIFEELVLDETDEDGSHEIADDSWVICNPADYCSTLKEFLDAGITFSVGDIFMLINGDVAEFSEVNARTNDILPDDDKRYILSATALSGGSKIEFIEHKSESWIAHNNTLPLSELSDEQAAQLFNAWRAGCKVEFDSDCGIWLRADDYLWISGYVYRIKQKSERELFIAAAINHGIKSQKQTPVQIFGELFDSGRFEYKDNSQHFGENI